jgi:hypothetical protein
VEIYLKGENMDKSIVKICRVGLFVFVLFSMFVNVSIAQEHLQMKIDNLEARVNAMEDYLRKLPDVLNNVTNDLLDNVDRQISMDSGKVVSVNLVSKQFSKVSTNVGTFLVAVIKREKRNNGCVVYLNIGNPNAASYKGLAMKIRWGSKWNPDSRSQTYDQWRDSLIGFEYKYPGSLKSGAWTEIAVELTPVEFSKFNFIEFQMDVESVELTKRKE